MKLIRRLARLMGSGQRPVLRRYLSITLIYCIAQGLTFSLVLPVIRALLSGDIQIALPWLGLLLIGTLLTWLLNYYTTLGGFQIATGLLQTLRHRIGDHVAGLPLGWFTPTHTSRLGKTLSQDLMAMMGLPLRQLTPLIRAVVTPLIIVAAMFFYDWRVALTASIVFPAIALVYWWAGKLGRAADRTLHAAAADASDRMLEFAQSQLVLRAHGLGERGHMVFDAALEAQSKASRRQLWLVLPPLLANSWVAQAGFLAFMAIVTYVSLGGADPGHVVTLVAMLVLVNRIIEPLTEIAAHGTAMRMATAHIDATEAVLDASPLPEPAAPAAGPSTFDVSFDRVSFGYAGDNPVLDDVSLSLPAKTTTVLVGPSGAGKTTILRLLARFYDPDQGSIRVGGVDLRELDSGQLSGLIAPVFQDTYLFSGALRDNVLLGRPEASEAELQRVGSLARLEEVVACLPNGWDSQVGEGGFLLSGGERQRVSIARALLKPAPILLFDEVTSALDAANEAAITASLRSLHGSATLLVITHRIETTADADLILFVDDHRIVEQGTHQTLLTAGGRYADFWQARAAIEGWRLK